jgi:hypothetical protein
MTDRSNQLLAQLMIYAFVARHRESVSSPLVFVSERGTPFTTAALPG